MEKPMNRGAGKLPAAQEDALGAAVLSDPEDGEELPFTEDAEGDPDVTLAEQAAGPRSAGIEREGAPSDEEEGADVPSDETGPGEPKGGTGKDKPEDPERDAAVRRILADWDRQSAETRALYPSFDFRKEISGPEGKRFSDLLKNGIDVRTAYEVVHRDEILSGAMQFAVQQSRQKTVNDIRARGMRPTEGAAGSRTAGVITKSDPSKLTRSDREEIARRVMRGEKIRF